MKAIPSIARMALAASAIAIAGPAFAAEVTRSVDSAMSADAAWSAVGDFCGIADWHPVVEACAQSQADGKTIRTLTLVGGGGTIVEELVSRDEAGRSYTYRILDPGPLPVSGYESTLGVNEKGEGSAIGWRGTFEPAEGSTEDAAVTAITGVYDAGLAALAAMPAP